MSIWTKQSAFDLICNRFAKQKVRSYEATKGMVSGNGCLYRGPAGTKCAVGHLIADADYNPKVEDIAVDSDEMKDLVKSTEPDFYQFLEDLQSSHDSSDSVNQLKDNLRSDAQDFGVDPTAIDQITEWA